MERVVKNPWDHDDDISILETYNVVTGERRILHEFDYLIEAPNWSRDGSFLVYNSKGRIFKYHLATDKSEEIFTANVNKCNNDHVLSADGKSIAVSNSGEADMGSRVYTVSLDGGEPTLITPKAPSFLHGWSPDGQTLAYCAFRDKENGGDIYTISQNGGEETQLTDAKGLNDGPEYDSSGTAIWFNSVRSGLMQAWKMKSDGTEQTQITFDEGWNTWFPHISPDGQTVVTISYKKGDLEPGEHLPHKNVELRTMKPDGTDVKTVARLFGGQGTINVNSWSPDSSTFAFVSYRLKD